MRNGCALNRESRAWEVTHRKPLAGGDRAEESVPEEPKKVMRDPVSASSTPEMSGDRQHASGAMMRSCANAVVQRDS